MRVAHPLPCAPGGDAVVVEVAVAPLREEPERDEAEDLALLLEHPDLLRVLREQPTVLLLLALLTVELGAEADRLVAVGPEHPDEALLDRRVALDGERVDRGQVALRRVAEGRASPLGDDQSRI